MKWPTCVKVPNWLGLSWKRTCSGCLPTRQASVLALCKGTPIGIRQRGKSTRSSSIRAPVLHSSLPRCTRNLSRNSWNRYPNGIMWVVWVIKFLANALTIWCPQCSSSSKVSGWSWARMTIWSTRRTQIRPMEPLANWVSSKIRKTFGSLVTCSCEGIIQFMTISRVYSAWHHMQLVQREK